MKPSREDVIASIQATFPVRQTETILCLLDLYGREPYEREQERVKLAILALCDGCENRLLELVQVAKIDCRDILQWASSGALSKDESEHLQHVAQQMIEQWGKK
jgi:hypothetical protein